MLLCSSALIAHRHHGTELAALLHQGGHVAHARQHLRDFIQALLTDGAVRRLVAVTLTRSRPPR